MQMDLIRSRLGTARRLAGRATRLARGWLARTAQPAATGTTPLEIHRLDDRGAFERLLASAGDIESPERELVARHPEGAFTFEGECWVDRRRVPFAVDYLYAAERDGKPWPNWRERLVCPLCGLNNRQRAMVQVAIEGLGLDHAARIYLTEQVSAVHRAFAQHLPRTVGSEFLGSGVPPGTVNAQGIRHEDLTRLSLADASVDAVLTFDVLEHVPDYRRALAECHRVLAPGGALLLTAPFLAGSDETRVRATLRADGTIEHALPPQYHGDPVQPEKGVLCFQEFGWDLLERLREAGFVDATVLALRSPGYGYLGGWQLAFAAWKAAGAPHSEPLDRAALLAAPQVGEYAWHAFTADPALERTSREHLASIERAFAEHGLPPGGARVLEVGAYRHFTGYLGAERHGMEVTLTDIAASSLRAGLEGARAAGLRATPRLVAADFHDLPLGDAQFDAVFVASSVHHTRTPERVLREMLRVLRPGGLLLLENEPCARIACFHSFCSNRPESFTPFERHLEERGLMRTISSPFPGARAEEVFGMVENDRIPAALFRDELQSGAAILEWRLGIAQQLGPFEESLLALRGTGAALEALVAERLRAAIEGARPHLGETDRLLGFSLPGDAEVGVLAARVAAALQALPASSAAREAALADLFGAALKAVARKHGDPRARPSPGPRFRRAMRLRDGVWEETGAWRGIAGVLGAPRIPDVYRPANAASLARWFPDADWRAEVEAHGAQSLLNRKADGSIVLEGDVEGILVLRLYAVPAGEAFALEVHAGATRLERQVLAIPESRLVRAWIPAGTKQVRVALRTLSGGPLEREGAIRVGVAQFLPAVR